MDDNLENNKIILPFDLVITADICMSQLKVHSRVKYCLHHAPVSFYEDLDPNQYVLLNVLLYKHTHDKNLFSDPFFEGKVYTDLKSRSIYQSWGTPYLEREFLVPLDVPYKKVEFFVGSIWNNDSNQGNLDIIDEYKTLLKLKHIRFQHVRAPDSLSKYFIRNAALATSIVGNWQKEMGYTPCRVFKAIAYGKLGSINSFKSPKQYNYLLGNQSLNILMDEILSMSKVRYINSVKMQQENLKQETYESKLKNILKLFMVN